MRVVVQRAKNASCKVRGKITGSSSFGLVLLVGFCANDQEKTIQKMARKIVNLRIFDDDDGVMNKSLLDVGGSILSISQFTLYADTKKGNRPSYKNALKHEEASILYEKFNEELAKYTKVETGIFREDMEITFTNLGPVTILLEREEENV